MTRATEQIIEQIIDGIAGDCDHCGGRGTVPFTKPREYRYGFEWIAIPRSEVCPICKERAEQILEDAGGGAARGTQEGTMNNYELFKKEIKIAIANYMQSEGCSCCRDDEAHKINTERLADLLDVLPFSGEDDPHDWETWYDFSPYASKSV